MRMAEWREALRKAKTAKERTSTPRVKMPELTADYRVTCNEEVNQGLTIEMAMAEASRCLDCANPQCVTFQDLSKTWSAASLPRQPV